MSDNDLTRASLVCLSLMRLGTRMAAQFDNWFAEYGITQAQFRVLLTVWQMTGRAGSVTPSVLAERLFIERPTATVLIGKLVERGLLMRVADTADRRSYGLRVTEAGGTLLRTVGPLATETAERTLTVFDKSEQEQLQSLLLRLETHLRQADLGDVEK